MQIKVCQRGGEKQNLEFYEEALQYFLSQLIPPDKIKKLSIKLILAINGDSVHLEGNQGQAHLPTKSKNKIVISVDRTLPVNDILLTLAHEAVHCKQFVMKELSARVINGACNWYWNGVKYGSNVYDPAKRGDADFTHLPWELDAVTNEKPLVKKFLKQKFS